MKTDLAKLASNVQSDQRALQEFVTSLMAEPATVAGLLARGGDAWSGEPVDGAPDGMRRYSIDLRSVSHGTGSFTRGYLRHEPLPTHLAAKVAAAPEDATATKRPGGDDLPFVYSGSLVVRGSAIATVTAIGALSEIGKIVPLRSTASIRTGSSRPGPPWPCPPSAAGLFAEQASLTFRGALTLREPRRT